MRDEMGMKDEDMEKEMEGEMTDEGKKEKLRGMRERKDMEDMDSKDMEMREMDKEAVKEKVREGMSDEEKYIARGMMMCMDKDAEEMDEEKCKKRMMMVKKMMDKKDCMCKER